MSSARCALLASCFAALLAAAAAPVAASCGSAFCPIDTHALNLPDPGGWALDLSFQYIDQDQPRIGTDNTVVGAIPSEHDEVRTLNRSATIAARYAVSPALHVGVVVPWISRDHDHLEAPEVEGDAREPESWSFDGLGDVALEAQVRVVSRGRSGLWLSGLVELPTGADDRANAQGEVAELPIQTGNGATDFVLGASWRGSALHAAGRQGPMGNTAAVPWFASVTFRRSGSGRDDYRLGDEWQLNLGTAYPLSGSVDGLLQLNGRWRAKDDTGTSGENPDDTGGSYAFLSPGARMAFGPRWAGYLVVQLPVYQDVNGLQLVAHQNWIAGLQTRF